MFRNFLKKIPFLKTLVIKSRRVAFFLRVHFYMVISKFYHQKEIGRIQEKVLNGDKIDVIFLVVYKSIWKADPVFKAMENDPKYNPCIIVIPRTDSDNIIEEAEDTYRYFKGKGYNTKIAYTKNAWQDLNSIQNVDIVFFSIPYNNTDSKYTITSLYRKITCYIPYFEQIDTNYSAHFNGITENLCWKIFQINKVHKNIALHNAYNKGRNIEVVGYPATEPLYNSTLTSDSPWKNKNLKKIIIAPHHSIDKSTPLANSTFLETYKTLQSLPILFKDKACFAFKPHPLLKQKLYANKDWGVEKTDVYWKFWESQSNTQFEDSGYTELFKTSDGMIHDCSSFIIEYLYVNKPCLYLNPDIRTGLNDYGLIGYDAILKSRCNSDIIDFVESVVNGTARNPDCAGFNLIPSESPTNKIMNILSDEFVLMSNTVDLH